MEINSSFDCKDCVDTFGMAGCAGTQSACGCDEEAQVDKMNFFGPGTGSADSRGRNMCKVKHVVCTQDSSRYVSCASCKLLQFVAWLLFSLKPDTMSNK